MVATAALVATAAASVLGGVQQYGAMRAQAEFGERMANLQGQLDEMRARSAIAEGDFAIQQVRERARQVEGSQIASAAAQGIRSDTGSMAAIREESRMNALADEMQLRNNAALNAMGIRTQSSLNMGEARMVAGARRDAAVATLLGGGLNAASTFVGRDLPRVRQPQNPRGQNVAMNYRPGLGSNIT